jgi:hypothetical protein
MEPRFCWAGRGILDGMPNRGGSQHPVDQLIGALVQPGRVVEPTEIDRIIDRMATAPFDPRLAPVPLAERGLDYQGRVLLARDESLFMHLVRRVLIDGQWAEGTTTEQYLADLRRGVRATSARLAVYARRGGRLATALTATAGSVPVERRGPAALPLLLVVYSADRSMIVTGYQVSSLQVAGISEDARWLR